MERTSILSMSRGSLDLEERFLSTCCVNLLSEFCVAISIGMGWVFDFKLHFSYKGRKD